MALRDLLSRFRSISRPKLLGSSGTYSSYVAKQQSAEDLIIDNRYKDGLLSPEAYIQHLYGRTVRGDTTPRELVSLQAKIDGVQISINDASVDRAYANNDITTSQVLQYEQTRLGEMTEIGSTAYIKQEQKVQGLKSKMEKEERTTFRISENLRISEMPEDTSERLWAKALQYDKLSYEARLDGDEQQAQVYETSKNNYTASAKRAEINDLITATRLSVSETTGAGRGVPSAKSGLARLTGVPEQGGVTGDGEGSGTASTSVTTGGGGFTSPGVQNALSSIDRSYLTLERLYQSESDNKQLIQAYQVAADAAVGDQKTTLTIQLNNLIESGKGIQNQIANTTSSIEDKIEKIQEAQVAAAKSQFSQEVRRTNFDFSKAEDDLETEFAQGNISKDEYVAKGVQLAAMKVQYFGEVSDVFGQYDEGLRADEYLEKAEEMERIHRNLIGVAENIQDYESISVDPGGKLTNLFGQSLQGGDVALTNVRRLRDTGRFDMSYMKVGETYFRIHYPGEEVGADGEVIPGWDTLSDIKENSFIYKDGEQMVVRPIEYLDENNKRSVKIITQEFVDIGLKYQSIKEDSKRGLVLKSQADWDKEFGVKRNVANLFEKLTSGRPEDNSILQGIDKVNRFYADFYKTRLPSAASNLLGNVASVIARAPERFREAYSEIIPNTIKDIKAGVGDFYGGAIEGVKNIFQKAKEFVSGTVDRVQSFQFPSLVGKVQAAAPEEYEQMIQEASRKYGVSADLLREQIRAESNFNPNAVSSAGARGIAQFMPATAAQYGVDVTDPFSSIDGQARLMRDLLKKYNGDTSKALAAYNAGPGAVDRYGGVPPFKETQNYVRKILGNVSLAVRNAFGTGQTFTPPVPPRVSPVGDFVKRTIRTVTRQRAQAPAPVAPTAPIPRFIPPENRHDIQPPPQIQPANIFEGARNAVENISRAVRTFKLPKIEIPKFEPPKINFAPIIQRAKKAAAPVTSFFKKAVSKVRSFFDRFRR